MALCPTVLVTHDPLYFENVQQYIPKTRLKLCIILYSMVRSGNQALIQTGHESPLCLVCPPYLPVST